MRITLEPSPLSGKIIISYLVGLLGMCANNSEEGLAVTFPHQPQVLLMPRHQPPHNLKSSTARAFLPTQQQICKLPLLLLHLNDMLLVRPTHNKSDSGNRPRLSQPMYARESLVFNGGVPLQFHEVCAIGRGEVQANGAA